MTTETELKTDYDLIAELVRQLEVTTMFLQLDARKLREQGRAAAAVPTEGQIVSNQALIRKARARLFADQIATA